MEKVVNVILYFNYTYYSLHLPNIHFLQTKNFIYFQRLKNNLDLITTLRKDHCS